jgi:TPR repeat protein
MRNASHWLIVVVLAACGTSGSRQQSDVEHPEPAAREDPATLVLKARQFLTGDDAPRDRQKALSLYLRACQQGERASCTTILTAPGVSHSEQWMAVDVLVPRCLEGDDRSCRAIYDLPLDSGIGRDIDSIVKLCDRGLGQACTNLESWAGSHPAVKGEALDLLVNGCRRGDPFGCFQAAKLDPTRAQRWNEEGLSRLRTTCAEGVGLDCADLALRYRDKFAGLDDDVMTQQLWARAEELMIPECIAGNVRACRLSVSSSKPSTLMLEASRIECLLAPGGCHTLARLYLGDGVRDVRRARDAYEMSCMLEVPNYSWEHRRDDCVAGAELFREDDPVGDVDRARAEVLLRRACELGRVDACTPP